MDSIEIKGYAKINIGLDITGRRADGYHLLKTVMQQIDLFDVIRVSKIKEGITLSCNVPGVPLDETNICYKAAKLMIDEYKLASGFAIHIEKNIPMAAGMAGGSTDGAGVIKAIDKLMDLNVNPETLARLSVRVGADLPFCVLGGTKLCEGIGEVISTLPEMPLMYVLINKPPVSVSTAAVYREIDNNPFSHPDMDKVLEGIRNKDISMIASNMGNVLGDVTKKMHPEIELYENEIKALGAKGALMSGSGPTVFGLFEDRDKAVAAEKILKEKYPDNFVRATGLAG